MRSRRDSSSILGLRDAVVLMALAMLLARRRPDGDRRPTRPASGRDGRDRPGDARASSPVRRDAARRGGARRPPELVSVVMPVRGGGVTVEAQLQALAAQTYEGAWELVIAANHPHDLRNPAYQRVADRVRLRVIDASGRPGISVARNLGAAAAHGQLLLFCDADDVVGPGWIAAMVLAARDADLVGGRVDPTQLNSPASQGSRSAPQPPDALATGFGFLPYATGASLGIWADVLTELGGFDEAFRRAGDDIDICWRAQLAGHRLGYAADAVTGYRYRTTIPSMLGQAFGYGAADAVLFRRYRDRLAPPPLRHYVGTIRGAPALWRGPTSRRSWLWTAAQRLGQVVGAWRPSARRATPHRPPAVPGGPVAPGSTTPEIPDAPCRSS